MMTREELIIKLKPIVSIYAQNLRALENLNEKTDFISDLKINSANLVDVILDVEESFDIIIDNESMERMLNVGAALDIIQSKLNEK
jgi:acyl carrier protein